MMTPAEPASLGGVRVVVTRSERQAQETVEALVSLGATVSILPAIEIVPLPTAPLDAALTRLDAFDWLVVTSTNGADVLLARLEAMGISIEPDRGLKVAAIGGATAQRLAEAGVDVACVPERAVAESLLDALVARDIQGRRVLLPVAEGARAVLPDGLRQAGAEVEVIATYRSTRPEHDASNVVDAIRHGDVDIVLFASPSAVRHTAEVVGLPFGPGVAAACIGPVTGRAARELGITVDVEAEEHSMSGLIDAVVAWARNRTMLEEELDVAR